MNKEYKNQNAYGVDFLDVESGECVVSLTPFQDKLIALTNRGSIYEICGNEAVRMNPTLRIENE